MIVNLGMAPGLHRPQLHEIDATLATIVVDCAEWEVLYRMRLQIERDLLVGSPVGEALRPPT